MTSASMTLDPQSGNIFFAGETYQPAGRLGRGVCSEAILYRPSSHHNSSTQVLLKPINEQADQQEIRRKIHFYACYYGVECPLDETTFYLLVPHLKGKTIGAELEAANVVVSLIILLQLARALNKLHRKNLAFIDLHPGNALWHAETTQVNLLDGGLCQEMGKQIQWFNPKKQPTHYAPELFVKNDTRACPAVDVYSLGRLASVSCRAPHKRLPKPVQEKIEKTLSASQEERPTLVEIEHVITAELIKSNRLFLENLQKQLNAYTPSCVWNPFSWRGKQLVCFSFRGWQKRLAKKKALQLIENGFAQAKPSEIEINQIQQRLFKLLFDNFFGDIINAKQHGRQSKFFEVLKAGFSHEYAYYGTVPSSTLRANH